MNARVIAGLVLILLGIAGFIIGEVSYQDESTLLKIGEFEAKAQVEKTRPIPPWLNIAVLGGGVAVLGWGLAGKK